MEDMGMNTLFGGRYKGRKVLITGHTGFKGSWLAFWLRKMGADVCGYSLPLDTDPSHFSLLNLEIYSKIADIRDFQKLNLCFQSFQPEIVFHLAAQSIVRRSYNDPLYTFETNIMGTANVVEACRLTQSVRALVVVTSDKCYQNNEWEWGYRENDPMGGHDPYSASKGCAELVTSAYRNSFFAINTGNKNQALIATVRAGNVIGGGDWAEDRLIPDVIRSASRKKKVKIRNPQSIRPWQHVLEPLSGYLRLGQKLLEDYHECAEAFNFGPLDEGVVTVVDIVNIAIKCWPKIDLDIEKDMVPNQPHEAGILKLDCSKSRTKLNWSPLWNVKTAVEKTFQWYRTFYEEKKVQSTEDLLHYIADAKKQNVSWVRE
jgi:CDP-glucose 4,6-dehydratase